MRKRWNDLGLIIAAGLIFAGCAGPAPPPAPERAPIPALQESENRVESEVPAADTLTTAQTENEESEIRVGSEVPAVGTLTATQAESQGSENTAESEGASAGTLTTTQMELLATLNGQGVAPELQNETWFNSEPLTLADLRGQVVIVEFWTYG